ncbi:MAG TPA: DbpA RNA binding domain-containing protein [Gemmatimonadales bacterium]|nr:DbpA RNA binding domain-containing protein [Gemmatimonadales bacterium]
MTDLHLAPALAGALEALGYTPQDQAIRDQVPTAARGHNLALAWPPAARYSAPALAGMMSAQILNGTRAVVLAPAHSLAEWADLVLPLCRAAGLTAVVAQTASRATRRLADPDLKVLVTSPATALALLERSAFKADQLGHVVLAWPEQFDSDEALAALMQDLPAEAQRIVVLAAPAPGHPLVERYARRAHLTGPLLPAPESEAPARPAVRVVSVGWSQRSGALAGLLESEDPVTVSVWCADQGSAAEARAALPATDASIQITTGEGQKAALVVAWDLPAPAQLNLLRAQGDLVLLVPPHAVGYLCRCTSRQSQARIPGTLETIRDDAARRRAAVAREIEAGELDGDLMALAPLFERHDPVTVAAALNRLWRKAASAPIAPAAAESAGAPGGAFPAKVWISAGKKDGATPADLVAVLNREVGMAAGKIGRIEIRELFSLVEVPAADAEEIARKLSGKTVRRRTVTAKVDKPSRPTRPRLSRD